MSHKTAPVELVHLAGMLVLMVLGIVLVTAGAVAVLDYAEGIDSQLAVLLTALVR